MGIYAKKRVCLTTHPLPLKKITQKTFSNQYIRLLSQLAVRTEHVDDFVLVQLLHLVASRTQILARVELSGLLGKYLADSSRHGQTRVRVDVNLADSRLSSLTQLVFGDTDSSFQLAAVLVDHVYIFLRNRRRSVQHDGEARQFLHHSIQHVECQRRRNQTARSRVNVALFGFELVCAVGSTNRDGQTVTTRASSEVDHFLGVRIRMMFGRYLVLNTSQYAQLAFNGHIILVGIFNDFLRQGDVFLIRQV